MFGLVDKILLEVKSPGNYQIPSPIINVCYTAVDILFAEDFIYNTYIRERYIYFAIKYIYMLKLIYNQGAYYSSHQAAVLPKGIRYLGSLETHISFYKNRLKMMQSLLNVHSLLILLAPHI